jgi:hypothetical protein
MPAQDELFALHVRRRPTIFWIFALDAKDRPAGVVFFGACVSPWTSYCHRHEITRLLRRPSRHRGLTVGIEEWPGGRPISSSRSLRVSAELFRRIVEGAKAIRLDRKSVPIDLAAIPWVCCEIDRPPSEPDGRM